MRAWTDSDDNLLRLLHARCARNGRSVAEVARQKAQWVSVAAPEGGDPFGGFAGPRGHCTEHAEHDLTTATTDVDLRRALREDLHTRRAAVDVRVGPVG